MYFMPRQSFKKIFRAQKSVTCQSDRYFRTSGALFESQVVKCPPFPESVTEGDVRYAKFDLFFFKSDIVLL